MSVLSKFFGGGKTCPVCGEEMRFLLSTQLEDGVICDSCVGKIRSETDIRSFWRRRGMDPDDPKQFDGEDTDLIAALKVEEAAAILRPVGERDRAIVGAFSKAYGSLFRVGEVFPMVDLDGTGVMWKREERFRNTSVVRGFVLTGAFAEGDVIDAVHMGRIQNLTVVEPVPYDPDLPFGTVIGAHLYKGPVKAGKAAWLILDGDGGLAPGDVIGKK